MKLSSFVLYGKSLSGNFMVYNDILMLKYYSALTKSYIEISSHKSEYEKMFFNSSQKTYSQQIQTKVGLKLLLTKSLPKTLLMFMFSLMPN